MVVSSSWFIFLLYKISLLLLKIIADNFRGIVTPPAGGFVGIDRCLRDMDGRNIIRRKYSRTQCRGSCRFAVYICQSAAIRECVPFNCCNPVRDCNACQAAATPECFHSNRCNPVRDCNACQAAARRECMISNCRNSAWNSVCR